MSNVKKIELAISDLAEALALSIELKLAKRFGETIGRVNDRLAKVEERLEDLDERASDDCALDFLLDDYESRISTLEDEMAGVLTSDDVREILESSDLKITIG